MAEMKLLTLDGLTYVVRKIDEKLETKVNVQEGYSLSKNDYSDAEKQKVADLQTAVDGLVTTGGQPNVIETVKVNDIALAVTEKAVNIDLSSYALKSDLTSAMYWKGTVATVDALPADAKAGDIYHVDAKSAEYAYDGTEWQELGSIIDLSAYSTTEQVNGLISTAIAPLAVKTEVETALAGKSDNGHKHEIADVNGLQDALDLKAVKADVDAALDLKADAADLVAVTNAEIDAIFTA